MAGKFISFKADLKNFYRRVDRLKRSAQQSASRLTADLALELLILVVNQTPVDTGRARAGWRLTSNPGSHWKPGPKGPYPNQDELIAAQRARLDPDQDGPAVYLVNNVEYIVSLEMGRSRRAPAGMVRTGLEFLRAKTAGRKRRS
ncbi:MAG: hypothetical protein SV487_09495 [Thermodesulfobacteriota bacterium]|nr:hypothetical protein [Thermodesulfobacteriota bacterium]